MPKYNCWVPVPLEIHADNEEQAKEFFRAHMRDGNLNPYVECEGPLDEVADKHWESMEKDKVAWKEHAGQGVQLPNTTD